MERNNRTTIQGVVVSNNNAKTIVVLVETHKKHAKYGKRVKYRNKFYAHDENNEAKVGDTVTIMACRKLSATKRFRLVSIDKKAAMTIKEAEAELKEEVLEGEVKEEVKPTEEAPKAEEVKVEESPKVETPAKEEKKAPAKKVAAKKEETKEDK